MRRTTEFDHDQALLLRDLWHRSGQRARVRISRSTASEMTVRMQALRSRSRRRPKRHSKLQAAASFPPLPFPLPSRCPARPRQRMLSPFGCRAPLPPPGLSSCGTRGGGRMRARQAGALLSPRLCLPW